MSDSAPLILSHQRPIYERLLAIGGACFAMQRSMLPLIPRTPSLVVGPTGTGKTFLAKMVARELGAPFFPIALSNWTILGSSERGAQTTWVSIVDFLIQHADSPGIVVFADEVEKAVPLAHSTHSPWSMHLTVEFFQLADLTIPKNLKGINGEPIPKDLYHAAQDALANRTFLIAAGAFQNLWERYSKQGIGFSAQSSESPPTPDELTAIIGRETLNRFRREILVLPMLCHNDYVTMLDAAAAKTPPYLRNTFLRLGHEAIPQALERQQGCRFLEDTMMETILFERARMHELYPTSA